MRDYKFTAKNHLKLFLCLLFALSVIFTAGAGCAAGSKNITDGTTGETPSTTTGDPTGDAPGETPSETPAGETPGDAQFSYSGGIDDNGYWSGVRALDFVDGFNYKQLSIPNDAHNITDDIVQAEINAMLSNYPGENIMDRAIVDGDTVNIDYVGSIDGVEFEGGNTGGAGTDVTIGVTQYIDDFLQQLIGHTPGETVNVEVTFPDDYGNESLQGKDALFVTVINHIIDKPELTDDFIKENLSQYGWATADDARDAIRRDIQENSVRRFLQSYIPTGVSVKSIPDVLTDYQEQAMLHYYNTYAEQYGETLDEFLSENVGYENAEQLIEESREGNEATSKYSLVIQSVAEDAGITVTNEDLTDYFVKYFGDGDYTSFEAEYGLPYLKQIVLDYKVVKHIIDNAILE